MIPIIPFSVNTIVFAQLDFGRKGGMSLAKQSKLFIAELNRCADRKNSAIFTTADLTEIAARANLNVADMGSFLDMLNDQAYLLKKGNKVWQLMTHSSSSSSSQR